MWIIKLGRTSLNVPNPTDWSQIGGGALWESGRSPRRTSTPRTHPKPDSRLEPMHFHSPAILSTPKPILYAPTASAPVHSTVHHRHGGSVRALHNVRRLAKPAERQARRLSERAAELLLHGRSMYRCHQANHNPGRPVQAVVLLRRPTKWSARHVAIDAALRRLLHLRLRLSSTVHRRTQ